MESHRPHWLTTRDAHGTHEGILRAFRHALGAPVLPQEIAHLLCAVKPTRWRGSKLDAIDLASNWVWLDDDPLLVEVETLRCRGLLDRLLIVDSDDDLWRAVEAIDGLHPALNGAAQLLAVRRPVRGPAAGTVERHITHFRHAADHGCRCRAYRI